MDFSPLPEATVEEQRASVSPISDQPDQIPMAFMWTVAQTGLGSVLGLRPLTPEYLGPPSRAGAGKPQPGGHIRPIPCFCEWLKKSKINGKYYFLTCGTYTEFRFQYPLVKCWHTATPIHFCFVCVAKFSSADRDRMAQSRNILRPFVEEVCRPCSRW